MAVTFSGRLNCSMPSPLMPTPASVKRSGSTNVSLMALVPIHAWSMTNVALAWTPGTAFRKSASLLQPPISLRK